MNKTNKKSRSRRIFQLIALFLLLVALPAGSWYYLKTGLNYQKKAISELGDLGKVPSFQLLSQTGNVLSDNNVKGRLLVVQFCDAAQAENLAFSAERMAAVAGQFADRKDAVLFITHVFNTSSSEELLQLAKLSGTSDPNQWFFLSGPEDELNQLALSGYKIPAQDKITSTVTLVDTSHTIRHHYQIGENKEMRRLIEHIALLLPHKPDPDIIFEREKEK